MTWAPCTPSRGVPTPCAPHARIDRTSLVSCVKPPFSEQDTQDAPCWTASRHPLPSCATVDAWSLHVSMVVGMVVACAHGRWHGCASFIVGMVVACACCLQPACVRPHLHTWFGSTCRRAPARTFMQSIRRMASAHCWHGHCMACSRQPALSMHACFHALAPSMCLSLLHDP